MDALIAAGGRGTRYFGRSDPLGKQFINVRGSPLIDYVLPQLKEAGIEKVFIAANPDNWREFLRFNRDFDIELLIDRELRGTHYLPLIFEGSLPQRYVMVYGHHPIVAPHLMQLSAAAAGREFGVSVYTVYEEYEGPKVPVRVDNSGAALFQEPGDGYVQAPWLLNGSTIARLVNDHEKRLRSEGVRTFIGNFIRMAAESEGAAVAGVKAPMPPEIDFPRQLPDVVRFIERQNLQPFRPNEKATVRALVPRQSASQSP